MPWNCTEVVIMWRIIMRTFTSFHPHLSSWYHLFSEGKKLGASFLRIARLRRLIFSTLAPYTPFSPPFTQIQNIIASFIVSISLAVVYDYMPKINITTSIQFTTTLEMSFSFFFHLLFLLLLLYIKRKFLFTHFSIFFHLTCSWTQCPQREFFKPKVDGLP